MNCDQELLAAIVALLPRDARKAPLITHVELLWKRKLGASRDFGVLIITTPRCLTTDGGNGWIGFDSADADALHAAVYDAVNQVGATGMIDQYIIRSARTTEQTASNDLDQLFE